MEGIVQIGPKNIRTSQNGKYVLGFKLDDSWWNVAHENEEGLKELLPILATGNKISFEENQTFANNIQLLEMNQTPETKPKSAPKQHTGDWKDEMTCFEDLLDAGHKKGLKSIETSVVYHDFEKKEAIVTARVTMKDDTVFEANGDASIESIKSSMIAPHFVRMAETRAIARALRWATNNAKTAVEEIGEHFESGMDEEGNL